MEENVQTGSDLAVGFIKAFTLLANQINSLSGQLSALSGKVDKLSTSLIAATSKTEDSIAALDDHRSQTEELTGFMSEIGGLGDVFLSMIQQAGELDSDDKPVSWRELGDILKRLAKAAEEEAEDEEDET